MATKKPKTPISVEALKHDEATRKNIPTAEYQAMLARARIMGARYPFYLLADSREGQQKEGEITRTPAKTTPTNGNIRHGFVYERVPHITLRA